ATGGMVGFGEPRRPAVGRVEDPGVTSRNMERARSGRIGGNGVLPESPDGDAVEASDPVGPGDAPVAGAEHPGRGRPAGPAPTGPGGSGEGGLGAREWGGRPGGPGVRRAVHGREEASPDDRRRRWIGGDVDEMDGRGG